MKPFDNVTHATEEGAKQAAECLATYWPEREIPVDAVLMARRMGVRPLLAKLPVNVSGAISKRAGADATIYVEETEPSVRQRFTVAHELGHYVRQSGDETIEFVDFRDKSSRTGTDPEEVFANSFAANVLMPEAEFRAMWTLYKNVIPLAREFRVSVDAANWRLKKLGIGD